MVWAIKQSMVAGVTGLAEHITALVHELVQVGVCISHACMFVLRVHQQTQPLHMIRIEAYFDKASAVAWVAWTEVGNLSC